MPVAEPIHVLRRAFADNERRLKLDAADRGILCIVIKYQLDCRAPKMAVIQLDSSQRWHRIFSERKSVASYDRHI